MPKTNYWRSIRNIFRQEEGAADSSETAAANRAKTTADIDALMALPIKERSAVTVIGDEGVSGYNPPPRRPDEA